MNDAYNTVAVEIYKNGESALFSRDGEQLTPFGQHDFDWSWERGPEHVVRVTDKTTGEYWIFPL